MNTDPAFIPDESILPSLFQTDNRSDAQSDTATATTTRSTPGEIMLDPKRLEAILKAVGKKKRCASRRT
jgi:hypothetical protein